MSNHEGARKPALIFPIAQIIIIACLAVFILTTLFPNLVFYLGLSPAYWWQAPWTIVTSMFTHAGLVHVGMNMLALYSFAYMAGEIGWQRFLGYYLLSGLGGSLLVILFGAKDSIHMGASGAIVGLALFYLVGWWEVARHDKGLLFALGLCALMSTFAGISWEAHLGGALVGALLALKYRARLGKPSLLRR